MFSRDERHNIILKRTCLFCGLGTKCMNCLKWLFLCPLPEAETVEKKEKQGIINNKLKGCHMYIVRYIVPTL